MINNKRVQRLSKNLINYLTDMETSMTSSLLLILIVTSKIQDMI